MTSERKARRLCGKAADYIEEHGWTRMKWEKHGRVCLAGAVNIAATGDVVRYTPESELAYQLLRRALGESVMGWNDRQKSRRPVIKLLRDIATGK